MEHTCTRTRAHTHSSEPQCSPSGAHMRGCPTGRHSAWHSRALENEQHSDRSGGAGPLPGQQVTAHDSAPGGQAKPRATQCPLLVVAQGQIRQLGCSSSSSSFSLPLPLPGEAQKAACKQIPSLVLGRNDRIWPRAQQGHGCLSPPRMETSSFGHQGTPEA